jgi:hypothetical protein
MAGGKTQGVTKTDNEYNGTTMFLPGRKGMYRNMGRNMFQTGDRSQSSSETETSEKNYKRVGKLKI